MENNDYNRNARRGSGEGSYYNNQPKGARLAMGIVMVFVYIGVGLLFFFKVFGFDSYALNCVIGGLLCAYGVWRGYLLYRGR